MAKLVLATSNPGKIKEYTTIFSPYSIQVVAQNTLNVPDIEETGTTFVENAILKARNACHHTHLPALGDDGGLVVDALQGAPGLYSARYAGKNATAAENMHKLITSLDNIPNAKRSARLVLTLVYLRHENDPDPIICQGSWELTVMKEARGKYGFGYLPILWVPEKQCAAAEIPDHEREQINHRGKASRKLIDLLKQEKIIL